jgi:hypothetical protein
VSGDQRGAPLGGGGQLRVTLVRRDEERVVRRHPARGLPHALHCHELGRVRGESVQLDQMPVLAQPAHAVFFEAMAGRVVDDQEDLAASGGRRKPHEVASKSVTIRAPLTVAGRVEAFALIASWGFHCARSR